MKKKNVEVKKVFFFLVLAFFVVFFSLSLYTVLSGIFSYAELEKWDGKTIADSFSSGNGTEENPYVIHNAEEFMYFKSLIEGESYTSYQDLYYELDSNIDFNGYEITPVGVVLPKEEVPAETKIETEVDVEVDEETDGEVEAETSVKAEERIFTGVFDGKGYSLMNYKMKEGSVIEDTSYFALFSEIKDGDIYRLNLENYRIEIPESNDVVISGLAGIVLKGTIENISLRDFNIEAKKCKNVSIGFIAGKSDEVKIKHVYLSGEIDDFPEGEVYYYEKGESEIIISDIKYSGKIKDDELKSLYLVKDQVITLDGEEISSDELLSQLNEGLESDYYWSYEKDRFVFLTHKLDYVEVPDESKGFVFSMQSSSDITLHATGREGTSVYINDLNRDADYYAGQNFTEITNTTGVIPTGEDRGLYTDSNLATVYIHYSGTDINDDTITGKVGPSDNYTDFYYYKRIPVVSGYIEFDLIDSPWGVRPTGRAFNGWTTDYPGAVVSLDMDTYVRHVRFPVNDISNPISITFYSSWTLSTLVTSTGDLGDLKSVGMTPLNPSVAETLTNYYCEGHVTRYNNYPNSTTVYSLTGVHINGGTQCSTSGGCDYINLCSSNTYSSTMHYYTVTPNPGTPDVTVTPFTPTIASPIYYYDSGTAAGYFKQVTSGSDNIYSSTGVKQSSCSGTCYQLMQGTDMMDPNTTYYYLTTRDTNIFAPSSNINTSGISTSLPMTITAVNDGSDNSTTRTIQLNNSWSMSNDIRIEYIRFYTSSNTSSSSTFSSDGYKIVGNFKNLKIGRGLGRNGTNLTATSFVGGNSSASGTLNKYTLIVESGYYQNGSGVGFLASGYNASVRDHHVNAKVTLGSDYDRVIENDDTLYVHYCYSGSWASNLYSGSGTSNSYDVPAVSTTVKSGNFGGGHYDYAAGIYAGGRGSGSHYALREVIVEGGTIYNLIGGPMSNASRAGKNDIIIKVKGGTMDFIFGGAGASNTVGSRILSVTGGTVNYSVLAGSNAYLNSSGTTDPYGKIDGDTLVYVGGSTVVGTTTGSNYNIAAGNVFGAGNGRSGELDVGSVNNSNVIIGPTAAIHGSVYGGGNFGAVGGNMTGTSTYTPGDPPSDEVTLYEDGTADNNIRYYGANPDNYIQFNNQLYRIVGLFNNVDTPNGTKNLVRIVKETAYNNTVAWSNAYITSGRDRIYSNYFVRSDNDAKSNMYSTLNTTYYGTLNATYQGYIQTVTWPLGALASNANNANAFYNAERGNTAGSSYSVTSYDYNIGLIYASDYGFASGPTCVGTNLSAFSTSCTNWISTNFTNGGWTMTPSTYSENIYNGTRYNYNSYHLFFLNAGNIYRNGVAYRNGANYNYRTYAVYPSFYLKEDISIASGTGTRNDPYIIGTGDLLSDIIDDLAHPPGPEDDPYVPVDDDGTYTEGTDYQARTKIHILGGTIDDSVYGAGNSNGSGNKNGTRVANSKITIEMDGGTVTQSIYGGSNEEGTVYGDVLININNGTIGQSVYGGGKGGIGDTNGTYVSRNIDINIGSSDTTSLTIGRNVYGGSAFGTVNGIDQGEGPNDSHVRVTVNDGVITGSVFGGGEGDSTHTPNEYGNIFVHINGGNMSNVFGGNDSKGSPGNNDVVYLNGGTIGNAYGGGNQTGQTYSDIRLQGSTITGNLYGGSNASGDVDFSHVQVSSGSATEVFGGNNLGGEAGSTYVTVTGGTISTAIYGGGQAAESNATNVDISNCTVPDVYGGGKNAGVATTASITMDTVTAGTVFGGSNVTGNVGASNVSITGSIATAVYGGNNAGGSTGTSHVTLATSNITNVFGGGDNAATTESHVTVLSGTIGSLYGGGNEAGVDETHVVISGGTITNVFGGSNTRGNVDETHITVSGGSITTMFGGNNLGGVADETNITTTGGSVQTIYGGGKQAAVGQTTLDIADISCNSIYGGGQLATVNGNVSLTIDGVTASGSIYGGGDAAGVSGNVVLDIDDSTITGNVFGGGNEGIVQGNTNVSITSCTVSTNIFAGGNGATAIVHGNTAVTIDGNTVVGNSNTVAPDAGCVFGSGNAAATGTSSTSRTTTVNIVGGEIYGNVYGGAKMSVVYGATSTNIGMDAVGNNSLTEGNIHIHGAVFGGGESNASGNPNYDYTFISVTEGIDINIDGTGYAGNNHTFIINGSIFGSGNASSSAGDAYAIIKNLGSDSAPNRAISIQRFKQVTMDHSVIELTGATDRTNDLVDFLYSFNQIQKLIIKNDTTLYLQHNANLLEELYSGVDGQNGFEKAAVEIDDDTKTVTRNVDNRIYMLSGEKLNIAVNQAATAYGKVQGMTFFGMYTSGVSDPYHTGFYDESYDYGDAANASLAIVGGSYVIGLRLDDHDITEDGFYTNILDEETYTEIVTKYINPSPIGTTGYRWVIGFEAITYTVPLVISKYSSLGTYELSMIDFADGNTIFTVLGFDSSDLEDDVELIDSNLVPRIAATETEANSVFGLSMKIETQEWTSSGTTKFLSAGGGDLTGGTEYATDSRQVAPSAMFYAYHAKNFTRATDLGECVITLQVAVPKNAIEYDIKFVTITVEITTREHDEGAYYDASITYDKKYEMPAATDVFITNQSQFTTYFSLTEYFENFAAAYGQNNTYYRVLTFSNPLPVGTFITMMDMSANSSRPEYYYYRIDQTVYNASVTEWETYGEVAYRLSNFIKMDSTTVTNTYDDAAANLLYYDTDTDMVDEEFLFIIDMKQSTVTGEHLNNRVSFELRNPSDGWAVINVVSGRDALMVYNTFESSNVVLSQDFNNEVDEYLYYNVPDTFVYSTEILYNQTENRQSIIDTNYEYSSMGLNVTFYDRTGEMVSSSLLLGTTLTIGTQEYYADGGGVFRAKLANKVSNIEKPSSMTIGRNLPAGSYTIRYTLFASEDGLHNSTYQNSVYEEFEVTVVSSDSYIAVSCNDNTKLVYGETGKNHGGTKINTYTVEYLSELTNPNFRVEVYKRDTNNIDSTNYSSVAFSSLFKNNFTVITGGNEVVLPVVEDDEETFNFELADNLTSGTYRVAFKLYDNNQLIDEDVKNIIVQKKID